METKWPGSKTPVTINQMTKQTEKKNLVLKNLNITKQSN